MPRAIKYIRVLTTIKRQIWYGQKRSIKWDCMSLSYSGISCQPGRACSFHINASCSSRLVQAPAKPTSSSLNRQVATVLGIALVVPRNRHHDDRGRRTSEQRLSHRRDAGGRHRGQRLAMARLAAARLIEHVERDRAPDDARGHAGARCRRGDRRAARALYRFRKRMRRCEGDARGVDAIVVGAIDRSQANPARDIRDTSSRCSRHRRSSGRCPASSWRVTSSPPRADVLERDAAELRNKHREIELEPRWFFRRRFVE